jgi:hypothetical protein
MKRTSLAALALCATLAAPARADQYVATHGTSNQMVCRNFMLHGTTFTDCYPLKDYQAWQQRQAAREHDAVAEYKRICALPPEQRPRGSEECYNVPGNYGYH